MTKRAQQRRLPKLQDSRPHPRTEQIKEPGSPEPHFSGSVDGLAQVGGVRRGIALDVVNTANLPESTGTLGGRS
ncbi:MAG: hypothetical protein ACYDEY_02970 [Acidimicrobiales bacterium]